jgi:hypothetical protein
LRCTNYPQAAAAMGTMMLIYDSSAFSDTQQAIEKYK